MTDAEFIEFLNENEDLVVIFGMTYSAGNVLFEMDPIAFRCMKSDYEALLEEENDGLL